MEYVSSIIISFQNCLSSITWNIEQVICHVIRKGRLIQLRTVKNVNSLYLGISLYLKYHLNFETNFVSCRKQITILL